MAQDEHPRPQTTPEQMAKLPPVFKKGGTVTAGNASVSSCTVWLYPDRKKNKNILVLKPLDIRKTVYLYILSHKKQKKICCLC